jgi:hypothetical protein
MVNSQLIDFLRHFTSEEWSELRAFVVSPYFNRGGFFEETGRLLAFVEAAKPDFSEDRLEREAAYQAVFPEGPVVEGKLDKVMSELHLLAKTFVAVQHYMRPEHEFQRTLDQMAFCRTRGLENRFENLKQRLLKHQQDSPHQDQAFFQRAFQLDYEIHSHQTRHNQKRGDLHIPKVLQSLDLQYFFVKTTLLTDYLLQQKLTQLDIPSEVLQAISESGLPERYTETYPVLRISQQIFQLFEKSDVEVEEFEEVREALSQHEAEIGPVLLRFYLTYLRNLCILLYNNGQVNLLPLIFKLQKEHLVRGYLYYDYYDNKISSSAFLGLCSTAFKLKEHEWVKNFIAEHRDRVVGDNDTHDYCRLAEANYWFAVGDHDRALDLLPAVFQDLDYHLYARRLELKIYYETGSELLPYKIDAFKMYLSRASQKVLAPSMREMTGNFVNIILQLYSVPKGETARAKRIIERIKTKQHLAERDWLMEKAEELL